MRKIKAELYNQIINDKSLSRLELRLLFWLAAHQDEQGTVNGVYYSDIVEELHCSVSGFYLVRDNLTEKNYITWDKSDVADMDITLRGNNFVVNGETIYENYIDTNIAIFKDEEFFNLKAGAIKLGMYFLKRVEAAGAVTMADSETGYSAKEAEQARKLWYNPFNMYKVLKKLIGVDVRSIKDYLKVLKPWIGEGTVQKEGICFKVITVLKAGILKSKEKKAYPEREAYKQKIKMFCRRKGIGSDNRNLKDTADLIMQYRNIAARVGCNIMTLIAAAIDNTCASVLNSYNVHKSLRNIIEYNAPGILA